MSGEPVDELLATDGEGLVWEIFHENSKTSLVERHAVFRTHPTDTMVVGMMHRLRRVKTYTDAPKLPLPEDLPASTSTLDDVLATRSSARGFGVGPVGLAAVTKVLIEAGHVAQSMLLAAEAIGLGAVPVGGYLDRDVDRHLGLDGVNESVVYVLHLGRPTTVRADHIH